jgi:Mannosyltransferase putative
LRNNIQCELPIEVWHSGDELSDKVKDVLRAYPNVTFCDIAQTLNADPKIYRGWQMKPFIIKLSKFDEVILMDADLFFFEKPESLFNHPGYLQTGCFLFCDYKVVMPRGSFSVEKYLDRRRFISTLIPNPSPCVRSDMAEMWSKNIPTRKNPFPSDLGESGCVAINKNIHQTSLEKIIELNENRAETYKHVYGDKETYWMGCELANMPYHLNDQRAYELAWSNYVTHITQFVDDKLFYIQKVPYPLRVIKHSSFINNDGYNRPITSEEISKIQFCLQSVRKTKKTNREFHA